MANSEDVLERADKIIESMDRDLLYKWSGCMKELAAEVRELRRDRARLEDLAGRRAVVLAFFRSVIHCREPWTDKCQLEYDAAMGDGVS